jgi:hypothetical protein
VGHVQNNSVTNATINTHKYGFNTEKRMIELVEGMETLLKSVLKERIDTSKRT